MARRPELQSFTSSWSKTVNWAKQNNIPYSAYYPIYQQDAASLISSGSAMSEAERIRAIESSNGLTPSTSLPTDNPNWTDLVGNSKHNLADIFTGLNPIHLVSNIFDSIKSNIEHPSQLTAPIGRLAEGDIKGAAGDVLGQHSLYDYLPGAYDLATVFYNDPHLTGSKGFEALSKTPVSAVLDIIPFGRMASETLGRTAKGEAVADRIGMHPAEMRKLGIWRVGSRYFKESTAPPGLVSKLKSESHPWFLKDAQGNIIDTKLPTYQDLITEVRNKLNTGSEQGEITKEQLLRNQQGTRLVRQLVQPALRSISRLNEEQRTELTHVAQNDFRPLSDIMADDTISAPVRDAFEASYKWSQTAKELQMQAGNIIGVKTGIKGADGNPITEYYSTDKGTYLQRLLDTSNSTQEAVDKAMKPVAALLFKMEENDRNIFGAFAQVDTMRSAVYESIDRQIPHVGDTASERLQSVLPDGEGWDRAVDTQTPPILSNLFGLGPSDKLTLHHVNAIRDLFTKNGLIDQMIQAYKDQDWVKMNKFARAAKRKFDSKVFSQLTPRSQLHLVKHMVNNLQKYAAERQRTAEEINKRMVGYYRGAKMSKATYGKSVQALAVKANDAHQRFIKASIETPPDIWRNVYVTLLTQKLSEGEKHAEFVDQMSGALKAQNPDKWTDTELAKLRQDPRNLIEIATNSAKSSLENSMLPDIDHEEFLHVSKDIYDQIASLRARGHQPLYIPALTTRDIREGIEPTYNVYIRGISPRRVGSSFERVWGYTPTIYDIGAGILKATKDIVENDIRRQFVEQSLIPRLLPAEDVHATLRNYYAAEISRLSELAAEGEPVTETALSVIERGIQKMGLISYDPKSLFGEGFSFGSLDKPYYIHKDIASTFQKTVNKFQLPAQSIYDRGTQFFRFSILGLSPRYTAHILFGGSYMVLLRANPSMFKFMGEALHVALHGEFSEKALSRFPYAAEALAGHDQATSEGLASAQYHYSAMRSAGTHWLIPEWLDRHLLEDTHTNRARAMLELNMRFTRAITRAQRAVVYLDGAARADKTGATFYGHDIVPRQEHTTDEFGNQLDKSGQRVFNATGKRIHDTVMHEQPMTKEQAHKEGMEAAAAVVGDLRNMTPLERSILQKVFPFYGWTKHVLQYVMSYPFDHPYRAMIVTQIAEQQSQDTALGLPTRIQLLTFLGMPDQFGNVTAIDTKALDPFRDTANYASLTGLFESLNPAITALPSLVDPQIKFGGQNLFPNVTYNQLYGIKQAGPGGNVWTTAEQFTPQLGALDAAFNLSGQYAYLKQSNGAAFSKKIFESLGVPFMPQQLNLRQMAAKAEIDRYKQAESVAKSALNTGDFSELSQYSGTVPDPMNPIYNVTPDYLQKLYDYSEKQYHLPPTVTMTAPPSPPL